MSARSWNSAGAFIVASDMGRRTSATAATKEWFIVTLHSVDCLVNDTDLQHLILSQL